MDDEERVYVALARESNDFLAFHHRIVGYFHTFFFYHDVLPNGGPSRHALRMRGALLASIVFRYQVLALFAGVPSAGAGSSGGRLAPPSESEMALDEALHELFVTGLAGGDPRTLPAAIMADFERRMVGSSVLDYLNCRALLLGDYDGALEDNEDEDASIRRVCAVWHDFNHAVGALCDRIARVCRDTGFDILNLANPLALNVDLSHIVGGGGGGGGAASGGGGSGADAT